MTLDAALQNDIVLTYLLIVAFALGIAGLALAILCDFAELLKLLASYISKTMSRFKKSLS